MSSTRPTERRGKRLASVEAAAEHNAAQMSYRQAERELRWLEAQEDQPPVRQALIRALHRRIASIQESRQERS